MHILWATQGLKWLNHGHKGKKANTSITENYSWTGILQNAYTPSLQEQEVQELLTSLVYQELFVDTLYIWDILLFLTSITESTYSALAIPLLWLVFTIEAGASFHYWTKAKEVLIREYYVAEKLTIEMQLKEHEKTTGINSQTSLEKKKISPRNQRLRFCHVLKRPSTQLLAKCVRLCRHLGT